MMKVCDHKCYLYTSDWEVIDMQCSGVISNEERRLAMKKTRYTMNKRRQAYCTITKCTGKPCIVKSTINLTALPQSIISFLHS